MKHKNIPLSENWTSSYVLGSSCKLENGVSGTVAMPSGHPATSFSSNTTVILGAASSLDEEKTSETLVSWSVPFNTSAVRCFEKGFLVIGSVRYFGGLHSRTFNEKVEIYLNNKVIDGFGLRKKPPNHSDYFHRIPLPKFPELSPFSECLTVYAWSIHSEKLVLSPRQTVSIKIGKNARWDIDYLGIIAKMKKQHHIFMSHNWNDKPIARKLANDLKAKGIGVWIDEAEIKLGDSLIEKIRDGIDVVDYLVVLLSNNSINSEWVKHEVDIAMNQQIEGKRVKVIPVLLDDVELPWFLKGKLYADLRSMSNYKRVVAQIEERVSP